MAVPNTRPIHPAVPFPTGLEGQGKLAPAQDCNGEADPQQSVHGWPGTGKQNNQGQQSAQADQDPVGQAQGHYRVPAELLSEQQLNGLLDECDQLCRIMGSSVRTSRQNAQN